MRLSRKAALPLIIAAPALIPSILLLLRLDHPVLGVPADAVAGAGAGVAIGLSLVGLISLGRGRRAQP